MRDQPRTYTHLYILRSSEGAGFPYGSQEAPRGLIIDLVHDTWFEERRSKAPIPIGKADSDAFGARDAVLGVFRLGNFEHMNEAFCCAQEVYRRAMGRYQPTRTP